MKYLFFDVECANCFDSEHKICEIGYILTDENFNIIKRNDIPISPGNKRNRSDRFDITIYKRDPKFQWAYDYDFYYEQPKFPHFYNDLKKLFEDEEVIAFGYAVDNDVRYLDSEFKRYKLNPFKYNVIDVAYFMQYYSERKEKLKGLENSFKKFSHPGEFIKLSPHLPRDDAYMAMRIMQSILRELNVTLNDILKEFPHFMYNSIEYIEKYNLKKANKISVPRECLELWNNFCDIYSTLLTDENYIGKIYTISATVKANKDDLNFVIEYIKDNELVPTRKVIGSNYFVVADEKDKERLQNTLKEPYDGVFVLLNDIKSKILIHS